MPRRPRPVTYAEAMAALLDAYLSVLSLLELRLGRRPASGWSCCGTGWRWWRGATTAGDSRHAAPAGPR